MYYYEMCSPDFTFIFLQRSITKYLQLLAAVIDNMSFLMELQARPKHNSASATRVGSSRKTMQHRLCQHGI
jgi:hypothetical protein